MSNAPQASLAMSRLVRNGGLRSDVVDQVIAAVFDKRIVAGDRLIAQKLAQQLGISATPVREALVELAAIGIVELLPNRGAVCRPFGAQQLQEIYQIRRILEVEATRGACGKVPVLALRELVHDTQELIGRHDSNGEWSEDAVALDRRVHDLITAHCGSARLGHEIARYDALMQSIRRYLHNHHNVQRRAMEEHLRILEALDACDGVRAADAMGAHIRSTAMSVQELMFPR